MSLSNPSPTGGFTIPAITGNPGVDGLIRVGVIAGAAALTTWVVTTLKISDPNLVIWVGIATLAVLVGLAMAGWGYLKNTSIGHMIANAQLAGVQAGIAAQQNSPANITDLAQLTHADAKAIVAEFAQPPTTLTTSPKV